MENLSNIHRVSIDVHRESTNIHQGSTNIHQGSTNIHRNSIIRSNVSDIYRTSIQNMYASKCIAGNCEAKSILHGAGAGVWAISSGRPSPPVFVNPTNADTSEQTPIEYLIIVHPPDVHQRPPGIHQDPAGSSTHIHQGSTNIYQRSTNIHRESTNIYRTSNLF